MSGLDEARAALLRALDRLEGAEEELGVPVERCDLIVIYSVGGMGDDKTGWHEVSGWSSTGGPKWMHAALLRRAADANDEAEYAVDDPPEGEE